MAFLDETGLAELWRIINKSEIANEYVWAKIAETAVPVKGSVTQYLYNRTSTTHYYGSSAVVSNGKVVITDVKTMVGTTGLAGNYFYINGNGGDVGYVTYIDGMGDIQYVAVTVGTGGDIVGYVNATNTNECPVEEGFTYVPIGKIGEKVQIATGSYTGTGTCGSNNKNSLTFDFAPKLFMVASSDTQSAYWMFWFSGAPKALTMYSPTTEANDISSTNYIRSAKCVVNQNGNTLSWYSDYTSDYGFSQFNRETYVYKYIAIG